VVNNGDLVTKEAVETRAMMTTGCMGNADSETTMTMTHDDAPIEYMRGQRVGNEDYLFVAENHSPGNLMLLRCCLEGIAFTIGSRG